LKELVKRFQQVPPTYNGGSTRTPIFRELGYGIVNEPGPFSTEQGRARSHIPREAKSHPTDLFKRGRGGNYGGGGRPRGRGLNALRGGRLEGPL